VRTWSGKPDPEDPERSFAESKGARGHAQRTYVCNTPMLNSRVAGAWFAASMPMLIH